MREIRFTVLILKIELRFKEKTILNNKKLCQTIKTQ